MKTTAIEVYSDGSGAPMTVTVGGYLFACDCLGEIRIQCVTSSSRKPSRKAVNMARWLYAKTLNAHVDAAWLALNAAMYA